MVISLPEELKKEFSNLLISIQKDKSYQEYLQLESKLRQNTEICLLIEKIKEIQKQLVKMESVKKDTSKTELQYKKMLSKLEGYPLYQAFLQKQKEVNEIMQTIKQRIEKTLDEIALKSP